MWFAACIAFEQFACSVISLSVIFLGLQPFISFPFPAFNFEVPKFIAIETVSFFGVLRSVFSLLRVIFRLGRFYFV